MQHRSRSPDVRHIATLAGLQPPELAAFLEPVPTAGLRRILMRTAEGQRIQRTLLRGFRPDKVARDALLKAFSSHIATTGGGQLAADLLRAWEGSQPEARAIAQEVSGRADVFGGDVSVELLDRLRAVLPAPTIDVLGGFSEGSVAPDTAPQPGSVDPSEPAPPEPTASDAATAAGADAQAADHALEDVALAAAELEPPPLVPLLKNVIHRDEWAWESDHPEYVGDDERLLLMSERLQGAKRSDTPRSEYAVAIAERLQAAGRCGAASSYWLAALETRLRISHDDDAVSDLSSAFLRCRLVDLGLAVEEHTDMDELVELSLGDVDASLQLAAARALILLGTVDDDLVFDHLTPRSRGTASSVLPSLFPASDRAIKAVRGSEPALTVLIREESRAILELQQAITALLANVSLDQLRRRRGKAIAALRALGPFVTAAEQPVLERTAALLAGALTRYEDAEEAREEAAYRDFRDLAASAREDALATEGHHALCLLVPLINASQAAVATHLRGRLLSEVARPTIRTLKPARVEGQGWSFALEFRNDGTGVAADTTLTVHPVDGVKATVEPSQQPIGRVPPGGDLVTTWGVRFDDSAPPDLGLTVQVDYADRSVTRQLLIPLSLRPGRQVDFDEYRSLAPYSINSISQPDRLKGRGEQLNKLREGFQRGASFAVTGQRRVGKTSLVRVFLSEIEALPTAIGLHLPLGEVSASGGTPDLGRLGRDLADRVVEAFETRFGEGAGVDVPTVAEFRDAFNPTFAAFLRKFSQAHKGLRLAFAFDDFDELPTPLFTGDAGRQFFLALRALMDRGTSFFFVGSERLPSLLAEQAERLNQVENLPLDYLDSRSLEALVREPTSGILDFEEEAVEAIGEWSARNPYFATILCTRLWDRARRDGDAGISKHDVDTAADEVIEEAARNYFQHFWSDSAVLRDEDRFVERSKAFLTLHALATQQDHPFRFVSRSSVASSIPDLTSDEVDGELQVLIQRGVLEVSRDDPSLLRIRVPVFAGWIRRHGAIETQTVVPATVAARSARSELSSEEVSAVADGLEYGGRRITTDDVREWARQFGALEDQRLMIRLLPPIRELGLFQMETFKTTLRALDARVRREATSRGLATELDPRRRSPGPIKNFYITHADETGKSGSAMVTHYRRENHYIDRQAGSPQKVIPEIVEARGPVVVVCIDDFVGTGRSAIEGIRKNLLDPLDASRPDWNEAVLLVYAAVAGFESGLDALRQTLGDRVPVVCEVPLGDSDRAFHPDSGLFDFQERERARELAHKFGSMLERRHPLGYEDSQGLVVFYDSVPNNTLPILCKAAPVGETRWRPLFPRN